MWVVDLLAVGCGVFLHVVVVRDIYAGVATPSSSYTYEYKLYLLHETV